jgi:carbamoyl-phosphate synthase large subunit
MTLSPLKLVLTACGCPGAATLIRMLRENGEREVTIFGVDVRGDAVGRFLCDDFQTVPRGQAPDYIAALREIVARERPDVVFVQSSDEVGGVGGPRADRDGLGGRAGGGGGAPPPPHLDALGARALVASPEAIDLCSDKSAMHAALTGLPVPQPRFVVPATLDEFVAGAHDLGYPGVPVCFKPPVSKGSRGFRVLAADFDEVDVLLNRRPNSVLMTLDEFVALFSDIAPFPRLLLMEYIDGEECTVDALVERGEILLFQAKTREAIDTGLAMSFRTVERPDLVEASRHVCRTLALDWFVNIQFKGERLLEVNPRVSTFVYQEDFNLPYLGIKRALGELDSTRIADIQSHLRTSRRTVRYYDQVFWDA